MRLIALLFLMLSASAVAEDARNGVLRKVAESGVITLGFREDSAPLSYAAGDGQPAGYSWEISTRIAEALRRELGLAAIRIKPVSVTLQSRLSMIQLRSIDLLCSGTTHTAERESMVAFSTTIFLTGTRLMVRRSSGIQSLADMKGKSVVVTARSTSDALLRRLNAEQGLGINIVHIFDRGDTALTVLQTGQADAHMNDEILLAHTIAEAWRPADWMIVPMTYSVEAYACVLPKGDAEFKRVVDAEIVRLMKSGEAEALYRRWLASPMPGSGINLNLPLSPEMRALFSHPNDKASY